MPVPSRIRQWWPFISDAAGCFGLDSYVLAALIDRESLGGHALEPTGPAGKGDNGHGLGLCQIDARYHKDFAAKVLPDGRMAWTDAATNIAYGASLLARFLRVFAEYPPATRLAAGVAAYNAGPHRVLLALEGLTTPTCYEAELQAVDDCTTGANYASDVLGRAERFRAPADPHSPPPPPQEFS